MSVCVSGCRINCYESSSEPDYSITRLCIYFHVCWSSTFVICMCIVGHYVLWLSPSVGNMFFGVALCSVTRSKVEHYG